MLHTIADGTGGCQLRRRGSRGRNIEENCWPSLAAQEKTVRKNSSAMFSLPWLERRELFFSVEREREDN